MGAPTCSGSSSVGSVALVYAPVRRMANRSLTLGRSLRLGPAGGLSCLDGFSAERGFVGVGAALGRLPAGLVIPAICLTAETSRAGAAEREPSATTPLRRE